jgi:2'-hydroxyisoflavone reductase
MKGPEAGGSLTGIQASVEQGLKARPLEETVRDTLAWHATRPEERRKTLRSGFTAEQEAALLAAWHARKT